MTALISYSLILTGTRKRTYNFPVGWAFESSEKSRSIQPGFLLLLCADISPMPLLYWVREFVQTIPPGFEDLEAWTAALQSSRVMCNLKNEAHPIRKLDFSQARTLTNWQPVIWRWSLP